MFYRRAGLVVSLVLFGVQGSWAQKPSFEGAWLEDGLACRDIFVSNGKTVSFKRPANVFVAAFIVRGRQLSTPLAACRISRIVSNGERQVLHLSCTTAIATESTRAVLALTPDGGLHRYSAIDGGTASKYQHCIADDLKMR